MTQGKTEEFNSLGQIIRAIITEKGIDILKDVKLFMGALQEKGVKQITIMQLGTLVEAGNIRNYLTQVRTGITMIDVNNMVSCAVTETGFTKQMIQYLLTSLLYGLNLPTAIAQVMIPKEVGYDLAATAILPLEQYSDELSEIMVAYAKKDEEKLFSKATALEQMVEAGIAEAQYLKGLCYWNGVATEIDQTKGYKYLSAAASAGHAGANAFMGDYYFKNNTIKDYTRAFEYYTQIGAVALSDARKENVNIILAAKKQNIINLVINGVLLIMLYIFNSQLGTGAFSANSQSHWALAIISDVLATLIYGLSVLYFWKKKYNGLKWATVAMFVVTTIASFWALM